MRQKYALKCYFIVLCGLYAAGSALVSVCCTAVKKRIYAEQYVGVGSVSE
jgi:hypothetical protein